MGIGHIAWTENGDDGKLYGTVYGLGEKFVGHVRIDECFGGKYIIGCPVSPHSGAGRVNSVRMPDGVHDVRAFVGDSLNELLG